MKVSFYLTSPESGRWNSGKAGSASNGVTGVRKARTSRTSGRAPRCQVSYRGRGGRWRPFGEVSPRIAFANAFTDLMSFVGTHVLAIGTEWAIWLDDTTFVLPNCYMARRAPAIEA
jgi:hypothetical protein